VKLPAHGNVVSKLRRKEKRPHRRVKSFGDVDEFYAGSSS